ncbi:MAG: hypothetical protein EA366_10460 [Spirulina sp. DLM2.Bin59]|nr:MAG: hypothetical protein EA366_10460 [Spirulina sp. DLM2.Bin59]
MNTKNQARNLMMRHSLNVRNRQQSMLGRTASEIGLDLDTNHYESEQPGNLGSTFDRSNAAMS